MNRSTTLETAFFKQGVTHTVHEKGLNLIVQEITGLQTVKAVEIDDERYIEN